MNIIVALALTLLAGMCTAIGGAISLLAGDSKKVLSISVAFAIGVMLYVSLVDLLPQAQSQLQNAVTGGQWLCIALVVVGMATIYLVERVPHHTDNLATDSKGSINRAGIYTALAIALHNIPEGMATFIATTNSIEVAIPIVVAIALHNIPEGIAISAPIYHATSSKTTAMLYSVWCGLAEPVGALIAWAILIPLASGIVLGCAYAVVVGIMVYIAIDMIPIAFSNGNTKTVTLSMIAGMLVMALSLALLG